MAAKAAFRSLLTSSASVGAIVGFGSKARVYQGRAPESATSPYLTLHQIGSPGGHHLTAADGVAVATFQIDVWSNTGADRDTLAEAVRLAIDGFMTRTVAGVDVRRVYLTEKGVDTEEPPSNASETWIFRARMEAELVYRESVPAF